MICLMTLPLCVLLEINTVVILAKTSLVENMKDILTQTALRKEIIYLLI